MVVIVYLMGDLYISYYPTAGSPTITLFQLQNNQSGQLVNYCDTTVFVAFSNFNQRS